VGAFLTMTVMHSSEGTEENHDKFKIHIRHASQKCWPGVSRVTTKLGISHPGTGVREMCNFLVTRLSLPSEGVKIKKGRFILLLS
jgi:hypothetical protein